MSSMPMTSAMMVAMMVAMMAAMMLPSIAPTLWRYDRHLRETRASCAGRRTTLFAAGYFGVWAISGAVLLAMTAVLARTEMGSRTSSPFTPWLTGTVLLVAGVTQRSRWKERQLLRCRHACIAEPAGRGTMVTPLRAGAHLGIDCSLSCAAPMAVLFVAGVMDLRAMAVVTVAITAERVAPAGERVARATGALALVVGLAIVTRMIPVM